MSVQIATVFERGGRELLDMLTHCVFSFKTDILFLYLVREYRFHPRATGAIAVYDLFCATGAPARISDSSLIPPFELSLDHSIKPLREAVQAAELQAAAFERDPAGESNDPDADEEVFQPAPIPVPQPFLFDSIVRGLTTGASNQIATLERDYDPGLTPHENLPGGELSPGQRAFVDNVWTPTIRPYLVAAGFWRMATIG